MFSHSLFAQEEPRFRPGKISPEEFNVRSPLIDSSSRAVVMDYADLRNFYDLVVKKENEMLVFKKLSP